jgi:negative regulator of flagellin synthesis FlgM|tara:strand:- start:1108 stop:1416 length:309 start_codon:yes stop_codon:yes gene_type:complete
MPINVNGPSTNPLGTNKPQKNDAAEQSNVAKSGNGTNHASNEDVVELSDRGRVLEAVVSRVHQMPDTDQGKIDRIRSAITNGEYKIDYDKLAAAFSRFESGL